MAVKNTIGFLAVQAVVAKTRKKALQNAAKIAKKEWIDRCPVDEGDLEKSIGAKVDGATATIGIIQGSEAEDYAVVMHEDHYEPGKKSKAKEASVGKRVGRKYGKRAMDAIEDDLLESLGNDFKAEFQ
jgi:hypothetical protein